MKTQEQSSIVDFVKRGQGHLLIEALAGSGKTFTLVEALKTIPQRSILVCAFNKRIAEEIKTKIQVPKTHVAHVKTFHALGLSILKAHFPQVIVDGNATENLITRVAQTAGTKLSYHQRRSAIKLLRAYKETMRPEWLGDTSSVRPKKPVGPIVIEPEDLMFVGYEHDLFGKLRDDQALAVVEVVSAAIATSVAPGWGPEIDFCDMVWLPLALQLSPPSRYHAIVVDEWQDISEPQFELIQLLRAGATGRLIMAGDIRQAIYGWRGAIGDEVRSTMINTLGATTLPLSTSFRCSKAVIKEAQVLVPKIKPWNQAEDGSILNIGLRDVPRMLNGAFSEDTHTFVLSRTNADLLDAALFLWCEGSRFQLNAGAQMLEPLFEILERLDLRSKEGFLKSAGSWYGQEVARAEAAGQTSWRERLEEHYAMLRSVVEYVAPSGIAGLLKSILQPGTTGVLLSTVHKVKGLEADRVFLLKQTFARHQEDKIMIQIQRMGEVDASEQTYERAPSQEELNIEYVAITRSRDHLIWVDMSQRSFDPRIDPKAADKARWHFFQNTKNELQVTSARPLAALSLEDLEALWVELEDEGIRLDRLGRLDESKAIVKYAIALKSHYDEMRAKP